MLRIWYGRLRREERGFTMPELMATIVILGILTVIAVLIFLALLERWRVNTAANQVAADLRLAHQSATNQLTDWRIVLAPSKKDEAEGADYYMVKLESVYEAGGDKPKIKKFTPRTLPANVQVMNQTNRSKKVIQDDKGANYYVSPASVSGPTRTLEFNSNGAMAGYGSPSGTVRVTVDENPSRGVRYLSATSRISVLP